MAGKRPDGKIRSGYVYSILPRAVKSFLLSNFSRNEIRGINEGLRSIDSLGPARKRKILTDFIGLMRARARQRKDALDSALILSIFIMSLLVVVSFIYAQVSFRSIDKTIDFIEAVLAGGGMHLIALPFVLGMLVSEYHERPGPLLLGTRHPGTDAAIALISGLCISALFLPEAAGGHVSAHVPLRVFYAAVSLTAGPAVEEIFFRYMIFMRQGRKYGHLLCGLLSSILFAAVHVPDSLSLMLRYTLSGCLLCALCFYRKNIFTPFIAHALANMVLLLL